MKKYMAVIIAVVMIFSLAACGSAGTDGSGTEEPASSDTMRVAMITDYGDITDQSYNQVTFTACKEFCEENGIDFTYKKPASDADDDRESSMEEAIDEEYNVIVMPGTSFGNAIYDVAPSNEDVKFIALDITREDITANGEREFDGQNVYVVGYKEEIAGYMAGFAAVRLGYTKLGFLGGLAVPSVVRYGYGFVQGADAAASEAGLEGVEIKYIYGGRFFSDDEITAVMDTWYGGGTEVVFSCGGGIYESAAEAAAKTGGKVIGVDVDQAEAIDGKYGEGMTVTSAMKGIDVAINTVLGAIRDGSWEDYAGQVQTLGLVSEVPSENYVRLADSTQWAEGFTEDDYAALVAELFSGMRTVSDDTENEPEVKAVSVEYLGTIME